MMTLLKCATHVVGDLASAIARYVDWLDYSVVEQGLVHKVDHPDDGRGVVLSLTAQGRESFQKTMTLIAQRNEAIFGCLSAREQTHLSALFDRLIAHAR